MTGFMDTKQYTEYGYGNGLDDQQHAQADWKSECSH